MTVKEYNANIDRFIASLQKQNLPLARAAQSSVQQIANRIFDDGQKSDNSDIGKYSTDPLYVNPKFTPNASGIKPTKGKTGEHLFKNGKEHKTTYIEGGYKDYQKLMGKKNDKVYLKNTNSLQSDFRKGNIPTKINTNKYTIQLDRKENEGKIDGINEKYGIVTDPTGEEVSTFERNVNLELNNELEKYGLL